MVTWEANGRTMADFESLQQAKAAFYQAAFDSPDWHHQVHTFRGEGLPATITPTERTGARDGRFVYRQGNLRRELRLVDQGDGVSLYILATERLPA